MKILDATAGDRGIWFDKHYPDVTFIDIRDRNPENEVVDCRHTRFADGEFDLVIFDPPHVNMSPKSEMGQRYGHFTTQYIRELCSEAFVEFHRILKPDGLVAFKWNDHDTPMSRVLPRDGFDPLVGVRVAKRVRHGSETSWVLLRRNESKGQRRLDVI